MDRIPALDGVRAIAIAAVLIGHSLYAINLLGWAILTGYAGVSIFFVLSGFLVTRVMLLDEIRAGRLRLGRFYRRRALRIFPGFYVFLAALYILGRLGLAGPQSNDTWIASLLYLRNFFGTGWDTGHLWSLALEEQFYFVWPSVFLLLGTRRRRLIFVAAAVLASTILRACWLDQFPSTIPADAIPPLLCWPQMRMDTFLIGAAFAIGNFEWAGVLQPIFIFPFLAFWFETALFSRWTLPIYTPLIAFTIGAMILWLIKNPQLRANHNLSRPGIVYIGVISYSLYLWQQVFLGPHLRWWSLPAVAVCALGSYYLIERPFLRWKDPLDCNQRAFSGLPANASD
ncbi:MAG TPA: acyltransferase [Bryobacteraceae bacterium]